MTENKEPQTTQTDFQLFQSHVYKWINYFGLKSWHIQFKHEDIGTANAQVAFREISGVAEFTLNKTWYEQTEEKKIKTIKRSAFHEVIHLLLGKIDALALSRSISEKELDKEIHEVVRILENTIYKQEKNN